MRRHRAERRELLADPKYHSKIVARLVNTVMNRGKKSTAQKIVYGAFETIRAKAGQKDPVEVFQKALDNVRPLVEVKSRRVGGATYQVPVEVRSDRSVAVGLRWIRDFARGRRGKPMQQRLAEEILDASRGEGPSVKRREDIHKMAEANRAFSHYRW